MPLGSKRSRAAKHTRQSAHAAFATPAPHVASPEGSEYIGSESSSSGSVIDVGSGDEQAIQGVNPVQSSVEAIQRLYSVFLAPHLRLEENGREKRLKISKRKHVYSGVSRTTFWRKNTALRHAAEGCMTLDAFVVRKVRLLSLKQWRRGGAHSS